MLTLIQPLNLRKKLLLFVVLPTLLVALYYAFWASDMYVSESRFSIRGPEGSASSDLMSILGQPGGSTTSDAYVVKDYIHSMGLLNLLDRQLDLRAHYQSKESDIFSRLASNASAEEFLDHFRQVVQVNFDPATGIIALRVRAYSPEMARDLGQNILDQSEELVNDLRDRALHDALELARLEVSSAEKQITEVRKQLVLFRQKNDVLNLKLLSVRWSPWFPSWKVKP